MKSLLKHINKGRASEATSLVETTLRQKLKEALTEERKIIASEVYGGSAVSEGIGAWAAARRTKRANANADLDSTMAPGGNRPGTNPTIKPKNSGLQAPEGQKLKDPKQNEQQQRQGLMKQMATQRQKASKARQQSASGPEKKPANLADAKIAQAKMQAAQTKLGLLGRK